MAKIQNKTKETFTGINALQLFKATQLKKSSSKVTKVLTASFKEVFPDEKLHTFRKEGVSVQAKVTYNKVFSMTDFVKAHPNLESKVQKFYKDQKRVTLVLKELE